jgi:hypothetical protein
MKRFVCFVLFLLLLIFTPRAFAQDNSYVSIVNPVRGNDFWELKNQRPETSVLEQISILNRFNLPATWLIRFDALGNENIIQAIENRVTDEKGLFLEVTPGWANEANVQYRRSDSWHAAGSAFLTGYEREEREKLIDKSFERFKEVFGFYPKSVGAWWIDSFSLDYMQRKYGIISGLVVADQYTTDNYQIWGQYFSTPYYPDKKNALHPAQSLQNKIPVVLSQWAARDPINGYGNGVFESTFSVQANDYIDYHELGTDYFSKLIDLYTTQELNQFGAVVVGLENTYEWDKYGTEYANQIEVLTQKTKKGSLEVVTLRDFAAWYQKSFPELSPPQVIIADDPLGSFKKAVWFMNPYYRAGWFYNADGSVFRDIRQYIEGEEEICFQKSCRDVNFATFATRVLDEVTYGHKWVVDEGRIFDFKVNRSDEKLILNYLNEAGNKRVIELLPRDIGVDGVISSIDGAILNAIKQDTSVQKKQAEFKEGSFSWTITGVLSKMFRFLLFLLVFCLVPGLLLVNKLLAKDEPLLRRIFLGLVVGSTALTLVFYATSIFNLRILVIPYLLSTLILFIRLRLFSLVKFKVPKFTGSLSFFPAFIILLGTIFQNIPTFKSGLTFPFGMGFWGPNTHDGIWHLSLINQLLKGIPVENPIYAETILKNYHFFYDLLIAATAFFTRIPAVDLVFRFFPILFSLLLGIGTYYLVLHLFSDKIAAKKLQVTAIFSLFFVYFSGSFGWIVEYLKQKTLGGESAFWANQAISFNLNPPFAVSVLIIIALLLILFRSKNKSLYGILLISMLAGSLIGFKAYGAVLILLSLFSVAVIGIFKKDLFYLPVFIVSSLVALLIFLSNFQSSEQLMMFAPFWFIHAMVDSPDRVGWTRLSIARMAGLEKNLFKFISAEAISLFIFIFGNLGMRFFSLFSLVNLKTIIKNNDLLFLLVFAASSFLIPILFIQSGNPWNTIQFSYYGLYITALVSGLVVASLISRLSKLLSLVFVLLVIILTPVNSITTASYYTNYLPHGRVDSQELEALKFLSKQEKGTVLTFPYDNKLKTKLSEPWPLYAYDSTGYVSALSGHSVYLEDEPQNQILLTDYKKRLISSKDFFLKPAKENMEFLKVNKIKYIYLPKIYNIRLDESAREIKNIFENKEVAVYEVKQ